MSILFQEIAEITSEAVPLVNEEPESLLGLITAGGPSGTIIIAVLILLLFLALYIYFERHMKIRASSKIDSNFVMQIKDYIYNERIDSTKML